MHAHAADLRAEIPEDEPGREALVDALCRDWRRAELSDLDRALCAYAEKATRSPGRLEREDVEGLRLVGLEDVAIHDLLQVTAYFNYINRIADGVHVDLEPEMPPRPAAD